ncbi:MAG: adenosylmethionine--8-amino-7-oxononanoate transaminase [Thiohalomonadales bacterium]
MKNVDKNNEEVIKRDLSVLWHPCTQMKDHETLPLIPIKSAKGIWLEDFDGKRYLDAISSWWVNLFGHSNPYINAAIVRQLEQIEHLILAGFSHEPAIRLAERLVDITPIGLSKCFYADNGSSAVEVALKMSFHYWRNVGKPGKIRFVNLRNSYHGETLGALSVGDVGLYKDTYAALLLDVITVTSPDDYHREPGESSRDYAIRIFSEMRETLATNSDEICAVIIEPLVQCAGGMRMYDPEYLRLLRLACDEFQVHLIADEIAVGFGRTGTMFGCEQADISPDFMCLSKGLTGGYLPLSAVMTTNQVYDAFYDDYEQLNAFLHSHSYTGNALACAAALACLDLFEQHDTLNNNTLLSRHLSTTLAPLAEHAHICDIRQTGMIAAIEMVKNKKTREPYPWQERRGLLVYQHALKNGVLLRPLGNVIYFMPPYIIDDEQIDLMIDTALAGINIASQD